MNRATALAAVRATRLIRYRYNGLGGMPEGERYLGVDAAQAASVFPESVKPAGPDGYLGWNGHELMMSTVAAVQGLADRLEALEGKAPNGSSTENRVRRNVALPQHRQRLVPEVCRRADPAGSGPAVQLIPGEPQLSQQYYQARVRVSQQCLNSPDQFSLANAPSVAQMLPDPTTADDLSILGAVINLWESLAGGKPVPPPPPPALSAHTAWPHSSPPGMTSGCLSAHPTASHRRWNHSA